MNIIHSAFSLLTSLLITSVSLAQSSAVETPEVTPQVTPEVNPEITPPTTPLKAIPVPVPTPVPTPVPEEVEVEETLTAEEDLTPKVFIPIGGTATLTEQADIDLFTRGKDIGNVQDNPALSYRRLVQRTVMTTEPRPSYGFTLTFDDQLIADSPSKGNAADIVRDLAPLNARSIFFANVPMVSGKSVDGIMARNNTSEKRLAECKQLLESKREQFIKTMRELIRVKCPADEHGNAEYACDIYNHTAFHLNMSRLKVGSDHFNICIMGIEFTEECIEAAYQAERPGWERARYFRFPFLAAPKYPETRAALNETFTKLGLICLGETQDSKDYDNYSHTKAYASLAAAKQNRRYNPKFGKYGRAEKPIALFHTKTWPKIKRGVIKAIKE